jgi:signal transduction histidine kinase
VNRRILVLAALQVGFAVVLMRLTPVGAVRTAPAELVVFAAAFALVGFLPVHLEFRRGSFSVVLDEAVWVVGLFAMTPTSVIMAAMAGDLLSRLVARQAPLKIAYNLASTFLAAAIGAAVFARVGLRDPAQPTSWLTAVAAMIALSGASLISIAVVLSLVEGRRLGAVLLDSVGAQAAATTANASIGLAAVVLLHTSALGPVLLAPIVVSVVLASRRQALQAADHLRFERLYAAAARTGQLAGFDDALVTLATEARVLLTGSVALCCAARTPGEWIGAQGDDAGARRADPAAVEALAGLAHPGEARTVTLAELPRRVREVLPAGVDLVVAAPPPPAKTDLVLAVFREIAPDGQGRGRREVLGAFAGHAALTMTNAVLYEEVDVALQHEIALSRQKSEFVAAVSHELRTPLTTVLGAVATIRRLGTRLDAATQAHLLARALDQGARLRRLIDDLLLVAAAEHSGLQAAITSVDIGRLIEDAMGAFDHDVGGRLRLHLEPGTGLVLVDEDKVRRIVTNLVENALKYAPDGPITARAERTESGTAISITDEGPGIPEADRQRVFEPFVQLDQSSTRRQGGTGLGLHLCRQLAQILGGRLDLDEAPGGGCCFTLHLPDLAQAPLGPAPPGAGTPVTIAEGAVA